MTALADRFRGYMPVVVDVETGGLDARTDALLEIAAVLIDQDEEGFFPSEEFAFQVEPFAGARIVDKALEITGIDPDHPLRPALPEHEALQRIFRPVRRALRDNTCKRAVLVGHNAFFDLGFLNAAVERTEIKRNPFHPFVSFDTTTLAGVLLGQTVLARALEVAGIAQEPESAHTAAYDARVTAELFCLLLNRSEALYRKARAASRGT